MNDDTKQPEAEKGGEKASTMMGSMLKGLREFGHVAKEKAEEYGKMASDKAEELTKLGKLKLDIHQLKRSRIKILTDLGELVFNLNAEGTVGKIAKHENFEALILSINKLDEEIAEKETQAEAEADEDTVAETPVKED